MGRTKRRIRKFRNKRILRPTTGPSLREQVIEEIHRSLYDPHWKFWHNKLRLLIIKNANWHGRVITYPRTGLFYAGQAWYVPSIYEISDFDIIPLYTDDPELEKEVIKVTANLSELDIEVYEVKRFLAGILLFPAPAKAMAEVFGNVLYNRISKYYALLKQENATRIWHQGSQLAFNKYAKEHDYLINAMCQRIMMNLIVRDAFTTR